MACRGLPSGLEKECLLLYCEAFLLGSLCLLLFFSCKSKVMFILVILTYGNISSKGIYIMEFDGVILFIMFVNVVIIFIMRSDNGVIIVLTSL